MCFQYEKSSLYHDMFWSTDDVLHQKENSSYMWAELTTTNLVYFKSYFCHVFLENNTKSSYNHNIIPLKLKKS